MQKFANNIQDQFGNEITPSTITVRNVVGGALSTLFSDDGVTPLGNPFAAQDLSEFFFYAQNGRYDIFVTGTAVDELLDIILFDQADFTASGTFPIQNVPLDGNIDMDWRTDFNPRFSFGDDKPGSSAEIYVAGQLHIYGAPIFQVHNAGLATAYMEMVHTGTNGILRTSNPGGHIEVTANNGNSDFRLAFGTTLKILETAAAQGDTLTFGQFWVRNDAPNTPMFTDDLGNDFVLNSVTPTAPIILLDNEEIQFGTGNDVQMDFNGTNFQFNLAGASLLQLLGGIELRLYDSTDDDFLSILHDGVSECTFTTAGTGVGGVIIKFTHSGPDYIQIGGDGIDGELRMANSAETDFGSIYHDGTDFWIDGLNVANLNISNAFTKIDCQADSLAFQEVANAPGDVVGQGQFWVRSSAPNRPTFTDDTGVDQLIDPSISEIISVVASRTGIIGDKGKTVAFTGGTAAQTMTIPANASVAFQIGTFLAWDNDGSVSISIAITTDVLVFADDASTGTRTLAAGGAAVAQKISATRWKIAGAGLT